MMTFYHGTSVLFKHFDNDHTLEGDGKIKHGAGIYLTTGYKRAAHYSGKKPGATDYYVYTVEIPDLTSDNCIGFKEAVNPSIIQRAEKELKESIPHEVTMDGKLFRKHIAMKLAGKKKNEKLTVDDEIAAADFLVKIGVLYNKVPYIWKKPFIHYDVIVMKADVMRIAKLVKVTLAFDKKTKNLELVEGSEIEIPLDSF
jgi:hypothetical protein